MKYELIDPSIEIIEQFNRFWTEDANDMEDYDWMVHLFKNYEEVDIRDYIDPKDRNPHLKYGEKDDEIRDALDKGNMSEFFTKINSI